ncbi:MAG: hypothetical protein ACO23V_08450 [Chitinophagaceae bacterium]
MERLIKPLLLVLVGLCMVMLAVSLFMPNQVMTSKWVIMAGQKDSIIQEIADLHHWKEWNGLLKNAENITYSDSMISWSSANGRQNKIKLESISKNGLSTPISIADRDFMKSGFSIEKRSVDSVQVVWFLIEDLKWYPWEKFYGMMAAEMKGPLMQESLDRLKYYMRSKK